MSARRAAAPWAVCFGRTRPGSSVVSWSLPGATYCKLVVVSGLWSEVCCCNAAGQRQAWEGQWSGPWVWFNVSGPAGRWLVGNGGAYQWTGPPGMWPCCSPTHFKKEQRPTHGSGRIRAGHPGDERGVARKPPLRGLWLRFNKCKPPHFERTGAS